MTDATPTNPEPTWPPQVGEALPRRELAFGVRDKLATYSLDVTHERGGPKARGFELMLGITIDDIEYLAEAIEAGILEIAVSEVRENSPYGFNCAVSVPIRGLDAKSDRTLDVRTVWEITDPAAAPRLVTAYIDD
jgi:Domain of unknown function (DUF6883)